MKKILILILAIVSLEAMAQGQGRDIQLERKFQLLVQIDTTSEIDANNRAITNAIASNANGNKTGFFKMLRTGFGTAFVQKTQNATSNILSLGVSYLSEALKGDSRKWYDAALSHCVLTHKIKSDTQINDFYAAPSNLGALDPQNIRFKGFGCHHFLEEKNGNNRGLEVFYIFCKMRRDTEGINSIVNHSKFLIEVDSLKFYPKYCGLPNDSAKAITPFDFAKRTDLTLTIKARIYSSWINEAIMVTNDQQLGEFTITARIKPELLTGPDSVFVYKKNDKRFEEAVKVDGNCFIVPRSYSGTSNGTTYSSTWGTGQYRIEMDVNESCRINNRYYYKEEYKNEEIPVKQIGNGQAIANAGIPEFKKFDKAKWQAEWAPIKSRRRNEKFTKQLWNSIVTAYKGSGWVETFTSPLVNVIQNYEAQELNNWLDLVNTPTTSGAALKTSTTAIPNMQNK